MRIDAATMATSESCVSNISLEEVYFQEILQVTAIHVASDMNEHGNTKQMMQSHNGY